MKITVAGTGYVGLSLAVLLARQHEVKALDIDANKVNLINKQISPIQDEYISSYLKSDINLTATIDKEFAYTDAELVIIATPTNYNEETHYFDTSSIDDVVENVLKYNDKALMLIKSTVPIGFTEGMRKKYNTDRIYFSPEFLREGKALYDNLYPSRIIIGDTGKTGLILSTILQKAAEKKYVPFFLMNSTEAEAVKLFANTYLASRVAYFNELDNFASKLNLDTNSIIKGVCADPRIGPGYNNPSFGYGGYCLPKDTKQLVANYRELNVPESIFTGIVESNEVRKRFIVNEINEKYPEGIIGIYKTAMKSNSDNNRSSSIIDIIKYLKESGREVVIYEPAYDMSYLGCKQINDFDEFKNMCSVIVANRFETKLEGCVVYTKDLFGEN